MKKSEGKPLYEQPGTLRPDRYVPNNEKDDNGVVTHYREASDVYVIDDAKAAPEFAQTSVNALDPFEDEDLLSGKTQVKVRSTGEEYVKPQSFASDDADIPKSGHNYKANSDPMAGGGQPVHKPSAFKPGAPGFFANPVKLVVAMILLVILIAAEIFLLSRLF